MRKFFGYNRDFCLVVLGQIISLFGNAILRFALPLHILKETGSSAIFGMVMACSLLPMIVLSLLGGVLADRVNKRNMMVILDFATSAVVALFYLLLGKAPMIPLFIVMQMLMYGISGTYQPVVQASIPVLVERDQLMPANAIVNQIGALAGLLGPVIGGMLYSALGITVILQVGVLCFFLSAVMEIFIHIPYQKQESAEGMVAIAKSDLAECFHFMSREKPIFMSLCAIVALINMVLSSVVTVGIPVLIVDKLKMPSSMLGIAQGLLAAGGIAGGLLTVVLGKRFKPEKAYYFLFYSTVCAFFMGIAVIFSQYALLCYIALSALSFLINIFSTSFTIQMFSLVQMETPEHLLGKVIAGIMAIVMCMAPLGQVLYGFLFEVFAQNPWIVIFASAFLSSGIVLYARKVFPGLKDFITNRDYPVEARIDKVA